MTLFPYQRLATLFDTIKDESLPQQELAKRLSVSARTIRTDVIALNEILTKYGAHIEYKKNSGYTLVIDNAKQYASIPLKQDQSRTLPRNSRERVLNLLIQFLTQTKAIKLDDIADSWYISRSTIQNDIIGVKQYLEKYALNLETKPYQGMRIIGEETSIRACLTNVLWQLYTAEDIRTVTQLQKMVLQAIDLDYLKNYLHNQFERYDLKLSAEGQSYLLYSCAISISRIANGHELTHYPVEHVDPIIISVSKELCVGFKYFLGENLSETEFNYLCVQIAARCKGDTSLVSNQIKRKSAGLIEHITSYINTNYNYDMRNDNQLRNDLLVHVSSMLSRIKYQIHTTNPLVNEIKQYYPFAYDITLSAVNNTQNFTEFKLTEDEISYLAVHIGVALERNYNSGSIRQPDILLVSELGNSTIKMIESKIRRDYPQVKINRVLSYLEYEQLMAIDEDFVVTTMRISQKDKPIVKIAPFPTSYQLEQLGRLAMVDRTMPYILEHFFNEKFFLVINKPITQQALFKLVCKKLEDEGYVSGDFYPSLIERESIVSTLLGENIAIPHTVGLLAKKTVVFTILAPHGIIWDKTKNEVANVIFLLAISKEEYEEAMNIYNLFVNFVKEKSTKRLLNSKSFNDFQAIVKDSFGRIA
ncbi:PRD domain-containing protein [Orbaceae bacterium ac157xtp]